jgi:hypothetical protein
MATKKLSIMTCMKSENPPDTATRHILWHQEQPEGVLGWVVRHPSWDEGIFHVFACWRGIAWMAGYVEEASAVWPTLKAWFVAKNQQEQEGYQGEDGV